MVCLFFLTCSVFAGTYTADKTRLDQAVKDKGKSAFSVEKGNLIVDGLFTKPKLFEETKKIEKVKGKLAHVLKAIIHIRKRTLQKKTFVSSKN